MDIGYGYALMEGVSFRNNTAATFDVQYWDIEDGPQKHVYSDDDVTVFDTLGIPDVPHKATPVAELPEFVSRRMLVTDDPWFLQTMQVCPKTFLCVL